MNAEEVPGAWLYPELAELVDAHDQVEFVDASADPDEPTDPIFIVRVTEYGKSGGITFINGEYLVHTHFDGEMLAETPSSALALMIGYAATGDAAERIDETIRKRSLGRTDSR